MDPDFAKKKTIRDVLESGRRKYGIFQVSLNQKNEGTFGMRMRDLKIKDRIRIPFWIQVLDPSFAHSSEFLTPKYSFCSTDNLFYMVY